ncbi:MAG TPA: hypothetical protein P5186_24495 [Candidatus Paceibacterota bacterium]|nr:hypothetical protein [Verrucomicrobiota bacterium]HRY51223.1 hypothetical protein [Candidatus Paceibacterota bacterium]HSA00430.1 hypothetical protein [Candidatus Paceibacterota bacterium]
MSLTELAKSLPEEAFLGIGCGIQWLVYTCLLWIMIKLQGMNSRPLGLLLSSGVAVGVGLIPVVGPYLSSVVLLFMLRKLTGAAIIPDVVFTVVIAGALMFCFNLFLLGSIMGQLRPPELEASLMEKSSETAEASTEKAKPAARAQPVKKIDISPLAIKGVMVMGKRSVAMIVWDASVHNLGVGETISVDTAEGSVPLRCEAIAPGKVTVVLGDSQQVTLDLETR